MSEVEVGPLASREELLQPRKEQTLVLKALGSKSVVIKRLSTAEAIDIREAAKGKQKITIAGILSKSVKSPELTGEEWLGVDSTVTTEILEGIADLSGLSERILKSAENL